MARFRVVFPMVGRKLTGSGTSSLDEHCLLQNHNEDITLKPNEEVNKRSK
ncbi:hypothetical protein Hanom_Chr08g00686411 [Helianthus anomalus]